jgi:hypothetical protein
MPPQCCMPLFPLLALSFPFTKHVRVRVRVQQMNTYGLILTRDYYAKMSNLNLPAAYVHCGGKEEIAVKQKNVPTKDSESIHSVKNMCKIGIQEFRVENVCGMQKRIMRAGMACKRRTKTMANATQRLLKKKTVVRNATVTRKVAQMTAVIVTVIRKKRKEK